MTDEMPKFNERYLLHFTPLVLAFAVLLFTSGGNYNLAKILPDGAERAGFNENYNLVTTPDRGIGSDHVGGLPFDNLSSKPSFPGTPPEHLQSGNDRLTQPGQLNRPNRPFAGLNNNRITENIIRGVIVISFISYTIALLILLRRHYRKISEYFSYDSIMVNLGWLKWITVCFFISYGFVIIASFLSPAYIRTPFLNPFFTPDLSTVFFIIIFGLFAIKQPVIFKKESISAEKENDQNRTATERSDRKYEKSGLKDKDAETYLKILEEHMIAEKPYLDSDLTIFDLSENLNIPKHYMTEIINTKYDRNFYMYVNSYRIEEAKNKLRDESFKDHSIIRIAYDCGFNSKSTFNNVFKKFTDLTPTDYRMHSTQGEFIQ